MIIVEGPDNSGKSTLIKWLKDNLQVKELKHGRHGPPSGAKDIVERTEIILKEAISYTHKATVVDRFSLIGESIYGPVLRGKDLWTEVPMDKIRLQKALITLDPFFIYCRPDKSVIMDMKTHQVKDYDTEEHVLNIVKNQELIIDAYDNYFAMIKPHNFYKYDYTRGEVALTELKQFLMEYLKQW